jgi:hypothetical protein
MRRILLLTAALLSIPFIYSDAAAPQQPEEPLPTAADYPEAGPNCKRRVKLTPWVGTPPVDWPNTFQCVLDIHTCDGVKTQKSGVRASGINMCADYWKAHVALSTREICCDPGSPGQSTSTGQSQTPPGSQSSGRR